MRAIAFDAGDSFAPVPLRIGTLTLADERTVKGFLCEAYATFGAEDMTAFCDWRAWLGR
jgi:allophanate hydrolase